MLKTLKTTLAAAALSLGFAAGAAQAAPSDLTAFDVRAAGSWAEKLVLCDVTAFLAGRPDLNANRMWVKRDDGHSDLLLPPHFVGRGRWYQEDYQRLYWRLRRQGHVDAKHVADLQTNLSRSFVEAYRKNWTVGQSRFLREQDAFCRSMARENGVIVS